MRSPGERSPLNKLLQSPFFIPLIRIIYPYPLPVAAVTDNQKQSLIVKYTIV